MNIELESGNEQAQIMVVDDDEVIVDLLTNAIELHGYSVQSASNVTEALEILSRYPIDVVITDIHMPDVTGMDLAREIQRNHSASVIIMTGDDRHYSYDRIIDTGASDFMLKPFGIREMIARLRRVLNERRLETERKKMMTQLDLSHRQTRIYAEELSTTLNNMKSMHAELEESYLDTVKRLALAAEYKDEQTGDHILRISDFSALLGETAKLPAKTVSLLRYAAPMHDVGKIGIPDHILLKPGRLTEAEFEVMKTHTTIGAKILGGSRSEILQMAHDIAMTHHEKWDGTGYPAGLSGKQIPIPGRIVALADVFDALTSKRPYKDPYPISVALDILRTERGRHLDPALLDLFFDNIDAILEIQSRHGVISNLSADDMKWSDRDRLGLFETAEG